MKDEVFTAYTDCTYEFLQASINHYKRSINSGLSDMDTMMAHESAFTNLFEEMVMSRSRYMKWDVAQSKKFMLDFLSAAFELKTKGTTDLTKQ